MCYDHPALGEALLVTPYLNRLSVQLALPPHSVYSLSSRNTHLYTRVPNLNTKRFSAEIVNLLRLLPGCLGIRSGRVPSGRPRWLVIRRIGKKSRERVREGNRRKLSVWTSERKWETFSILFRAFHFHHVKHQLKAPSLAGPLTFLQPLVLVISVILMNNIYTNLHRCDFVSVLSGLQTQT